MIHARLLSARHVEIQRPDMSEVLLPETQRHDVDEHVCELSARRRVQRRQEPRFTNISERLCRRAQDVCRCAQMQTYAPSMITI